MTSMSPRISRKETVSEVEQAIDDEVFARSASLQ